MELENGFSGDDIRAIATPGSYVKAWDYLDSVDYLYAEAERVTAIVHGTAPYRVRLTTTPKLSGECDCPYGTEGNFCKHCVAVALLVLGEPDEPLRAEQPKRTRTEDLDADIDAVIARRAGHLAPDGMTHLEIAHGLDAAGRNEQALDWAERGLRHARRTPPHDQLVDYVAKRYQAEGRMPDAVTVRRDRLAARPSLLSYQRLRADAIAAGCWDGERQAALDVLRDAPKPPSGWDQDPGTPVVDALIDDGDVEAAWAQAVRAGTRVSEDQWLRLADLIRASRPGDALPVYMRHIQSLRTVTGNETYIVLARLLVKARECHRLLGTEAEFRRYLRHLRADLKRRRNLLLTLDKHGL